MKTTHSIFFLLFPVFVFAGQMPVNKDVKVIITPNHSDWNYVPGENVTFKLEVQKNGVTIPNVEITYQYGPESQPPSKVETFVLQNGSRTIDAGSLKQPGFLRLLAKVEYEKDVIENMCTVAFGPQMITPTVSLPDDFSNFWLKSIEKSKGIPLDPIFEIQANQCTNEVDVFHVSFQSYRLNARIYGWLAVPKKKGAYPAIIEFPGAGVWKKQADTYTASKGFVTLQIFIHGIPLTMPDSIYDILKSSVLNEYYLHGIENIDSYYYKRVIIGCLSSIDFLSKLPQYDGQNLGVSGQSQGGALTIITAALDKRVKAFVAFHPALCDLTGYLQDRAGGWPDIFKYYNGMSSDELKSKIKVMSYYDVVNFAKNITQPCYFSGGYNDNVCSPTSYFSAYNIIQSPKSMVIYKETGHWVYPEQQSKAQQWLMNQLK